MAPVLHMNLFDRFSRVAKAGLNDILNKVEDPEKIMNQALEDMQVRVAGMIMTGFVFRLTAKNLSSQRCIFSFTMCRATWSRSVNRTPKSRRRNVV
jgi:hypothetical protein